MIATFYREPGIRDNNFYCDTVPIQINCVCCQSLYGGCSGNNTRKDYYLFYLKEGTVTVTAPISSVMHSGDMILFQPSVPFSYVGTGTNNPYTTHYAIHFTGFLAAELLQKCKLRTNTVYSVGHLEEVDELFHAIFRSFLLRNDLFRTDTACKLTELLTDIGRLLYRRDPKPSADNARKMETSLSFIHSNFSKEIKICDLAKLEHLSENRYRTLFTELIGQSPISYITELRLQSACGLPRQSSMSIAQIAKAVGYPDGQYFARIFRKKYQMTPREYRHQS